MDHKSILFVLGGLVTNLVGAEERHAKVEAFTACEAAKQAVNNAPAALEVGEAVRPRPSSLYSIETQILEGPIIGSANMRALFLANPEEVPQVLATVASGITRTGPTQVVWYGPLISSTKRQSEMRLSGLEHLYTFIHRQDQASRFNFAIGSKSLLRNRTAAETLAFIADLRNCAAAAWKEAGGHKVPSWTVVTFAPLSFGGKGRKDVAVRIRDLKGQPINGASVAFNRGDHLTCQAWTDMQGVARCTLTDFHGHNDHSAHERRTQTYVNFAGKVEPDFIAVPSTMVVQ